MIRKDIAKFEQQLTQHRQLYGDKAPTIRKPIEDSLAEVRRVAADEVSALKALCEHMKKCAVQWRALGAMEPLVARARTDAHG